MTETSPELLSNTPLVLPLAAPEATLALVGGKGASLARMASIGLPVPPGFHITTTAYRRFVEVNNLQTAIITAASTAHADDPASLDTASSSIHALFEAAFMPEEIITPIRQAYTELGGELPAVAVRSSATAEDLPGMSFAGQQESYLNMRGATMVLDAVKRCWASLWTARAIGYRLRQGIAPQEVSLAVVIQELIPADVAGILFTANPMSGARHEIMINAAWGLGEAIVGGQVTPDSFVVDKQTGRIQAQEIATKEIMTVRTVHGTEDVTVPLERQRQATLTPAQVAQLAQLGERIEGLYDQPMDIEWAIAQDDIFILQARPITALPPATSGAVQAPALEWKLPHPSGKYARGSVIELLPDPLSPLFATLGLPAWSREMVGLMAEAGLTGALVDEMLTTINGYAYYDISMTGAQTLKFIKAIPQVASRAALWFRRARERWEDEARPQYAARVALWQAMDVHMTPAGKLLDGVRDIIDVAAHHYLTIQSGILPAAYMSEALFTLVYNRLVRRSADPLALTFMLGYESAPIRAEESLYDLGQWARMQPDLAAYLANTPPSQLVAALHTSTPPDGVADTTWQEFQGRFTTHLEHFGYTIYDLDFVKALPKDDPTPLLSTLVFFLDPEAPNPYQRQRTAAAARDQAMAQLLGKRRGLGLALCWSLLRKAQRFAPLREDALADVGLGWPLLRSMLHELGRRLQDAGALATVDDIFWLEKDELQAAVAALDAGSEIASYRAAIAERRTLWARERKLTPPSALPIKGGATFLGVDFSRFMPAQTEQAEGNTIKGIGASPGSITGTARVIHDSQEFDQMRAGDILVAKITTPAWTPLFALAGGVVTDVGGPLSHSSIVAREYHIPAVLGTGVATARLHSGQQITVDGDAGTVLT